jgi:hypothetical protein
MMRDVLLPRTDHAVVVQALVVFPLLMAALVFARRDREWRTFILGLLVITLGFFGLRALH